jgi:uncharacterized membrane protein YgdD (TMEM256/DUF423 family)
MEWIRASGVSGAIAVALGAFGAHALRDRVDARAMRTWETAASYHLVHALALGIVGAARVRSVAGHLFAAGTLLFSGSLYALVITGERRLGVITPVGGVLLIGGWVALATATAPRSVALPAGEHPKAA